jgi:quinoprotein glucose dehydrogenase
MFHLLAALAAFGGVVLGGYAWMVEGTGVDGTPGALLALVGAVAVWLASLALAVPGLRGWLRGLIRFLAILGAVLTAVAAWFLMQNLFAGAMALAAVALLLPAPQSTSGRRARA